MKWFGFAAEEDKAAVEAAEKAKKEQEVDQEVRDLIASADPDNREFLKVLVAAIRIGANIQKEEGTMFAFGRLIINAARNITGTAETLSAANKLRHMLNDETGLNLSDLTNILSNSNNQRKLLTSNLFKKLAKDEGFWKVMILETPRIRKAVDIHKDEIAESLKSSLISHDDLHTLLEWVDGMLPAFDNKEDKKTLVEFLAKISPETVGIIADILDPIEGDKDVVSKMFPWLTALGDSDADKVRLNPLFQVVIDRTDPNDVLPVITKLFNTKQSLKASLFLIEMALGDNLLKFIEESELGQKSLRQVEMSIDDVRNLFAVAKKALPKLAEGQDIITDLFQRVEAAAQVEAAKAIAHEAEVKAVAAAHAEADGEDTAESEQPKKPKRDLNPATLIPLLVVALKTPGLFQILNNTAQAALEDEFDTFLKNNEAIQKQLKGFGLTANDTQRLIIMLKNALNEASTQERQNEAARLLENMQEPLIDVLDAILEDYKRPEGEKQGFDNTLLIPLVAKAFHTPGLFIGLNVIFQQVLGEELNSFIDENKALEGRLQGFGLSPDDAKVLIVMFKKALQETVKEENQAHAARIFDQVTPELEILLKAMAEDAKLPEEEQQGFDPSLLLPLLSKGLKTPGLFEALKIIAEDILGDDLNTLIDENAAIKKRLEKYDLSPDDVKKLVTVLKRVIALTAQKQDDTTKLFDNLQPEIAALLKEMADEARRPEDEKKGLNTVMMLPIARKALQTPGLFKYLNQACEEVLVGDELAHIMKKNSNVMSLFKGFNLDENAVDAAVYVTKAVLPKIADKQENVEVLFSNMEPVLAKILRVQANRSKTPPVISENDDLTSKEKTVLANAAFNFMCAVDAGELAASLADDHNFVENAAKLVTTSAVKMPDKFKRELVEFALKGSILALDGGTLKSKQNIFLKNISTALDDKLTFKQRHDAIFAIADIFVNQLRTHEGKKLIKEDLKALINDNRPTCIALFNAYIKDYPNIEKLGIKPDTLFNALTKEGMLDDMLELYDLYKDHRKMKTVGKGIKLFMKNTELRVVIFDAIINWALSFIRDTLLPGFFKRALVNGACHETLNKFTIEAAEANFKGEIFDLNEKLREAAEKKTGIKSYTLKFVEFSDLDLRDVNFSNMKMTNMNLKNTILGGNRTGLLLENCKITDSDFSNIIIKGDIINLKNTEIDGKTLLTLIDALERQQQAGTKINLEGLKITSVGRLSYEEKTRLKQFKPINSVLQKQSASDRASEQAVDNAIATNNEGPSR